MNGKLAVHMTLLFCGACLGVLAGLTIARKIQLQTGRDELESYASRVLADGPHFVAESDRALKVVTEANLPFCSDQELALTRDYVYNSQHVKHIGRIKEGILYCTTGVGRLNPPTSMPAKPSISVNGINIYGLVRLVFSNKSKGLVVEHNGVSVVLNPDSYKSLDEPPMFSSGFLYDSRIALVVNVFGQAVPLTGPEVIAGRFIERDGFFLRPLCAPSELICVVAGERRDDILTRSQGFFRGFLIGGGVLGTALTLILILLNRRQHSLERQLRRAVRRGALTFVYQPIVDLDTGIIVGAEALARWTNEDREQVGPDVFINLAEKAGFVGEITRLGMRRAVEELGDLLNQGSFRVTLNISSEDLTDPLFFESLEGCLRTAMVRPSAMGLELTERSTADHSVAIEGVSRLKRAGHTVYIDDFGTGYSSLSYLHRLTVDAIKIDRSFTQTVGTEAVTASVVPQILDMARQLALLVVVEGIETQGQVEYFRTAGDRILGQGYLFSRPVSAAHLKSLVVGRTQTQS